MRSALLVADVVRRTLLAWRFEVFWTQLRLPREALRERPHVALVELVP